MKGNPVPPIPLGFIHSHDKVKKLLPKLLAPCVSTISPSLPPVFIYQDFRRVQPAAALTISYSAKGTFDSFHHLQIIPPPPNKLTRSTLIQPHKLVRSNRRTP